MCYAKQLTTSLKTQEQIQFYDHKLLILLLAEYNFSFPYLPNSDSHYWLIRDS